MIFKYLTNKSQYKFLLMGVGLSHTSLKKNQDMENYDQIIIKT